MTKMEFSSASMEDLRVPNFHDAAEKQEFLEAMYAGEVPVPLKLQAQGVDFTDERYVAEGARLRCIPTFSAAAPGYKIVERDLSHLSHAQRGALFLDENDRRAREQVAYVRERHPHAILGGNVMKKLTGYSRSVDAFGESGGVDILDAGAGILDADDLRQTMKYPGMEMDPIVSSSTAARWTVRVAKQINMKIRLLLVELHNLAGGHLGGDPEEDVDPVAIREGIRKFAPETPVILAGGIAYRDQIKHALAMGYQGVGIATRGLMTQESGLSDELIKSVYLNPEYRVVAHNGSPTGYPGRYIDVPGHTRTPEERLAYVQYAVRNCISCIEPGSCKFLIGAKDPNDPHFCIGQDLPRTRFGKPGGICFTGTVRDQIMHDPIFRDEEGNLRVPTLEESLNYMLTHDAPAVPPEKA